MRVPVGVVALMACAVFTGGCSQAGTEMTGAFEAGPPSSIATSTGKCRDEATGPSTYRYAERPGVDPERNSLDVYLPAGCDLSPVVMWIHGGGWRVGDKAQGFVERKAAWADSLGRALVSANYRLSTPGSGVRWPDHGEDVAAAVAWVQQHGPEVGLDPTDVTLLGHSAGAHLVAIVGTDPSLLNAVGGNPADVACVVALDFAFDLGAGPASNLVANAFGADPEVLAAASPSVQVERNGAPTAQFLVGMRGGPARVAEAQSFVDLVNDKGGTADLLNVNPYNHAEISSRLGADGESLVTPAVSEFVRSCA